MSRNITDLHPTLQSKITELKALCKKKGIEIGISECLRTVAEQDALYAKGRTTAGSIVTNAKGSSYSSMHQWGVAFDFYLIMDVDGDGKTSDDAFNDSTGLFSVVGKLGQSIGLEWGGSWKSIKDKPHFQLPDWGSTATKLKATYGTPQKFFATWQNSATSTATASSATTVGYERTQFIMDVQAATGSKVDGKAGNETIGNTPTISKTKNRKHPVVIPLQKYLNALGYDCGTVDGIAGVKFDAAAKAYQKANGCVVDGELTSGKKTWKKLLGML